MNKTLELKKGDKFKIRSFHYWGGNYDNGDNKSYDVEIIIPEITRAGQVYCSVNNNPPQYLFVKHLFKEGESQ